MSAIVSECGTYRYRLEFRVDAVVALHGVAFIGVCPPREDTARDNVTVRKWRGFTARIGGSHFVVGDVFAFRTKDLRELKSANDPVGPENDRHLASIIAEAAIVVPCWGSRVNVHRALRYRFDQVEDLLRNSGRPVMTFGYSKEGDPLHPLTLPYTTPLVEWRLP